VIAGLATLVLCLVAAALTPHAWREALRENAFDLVLAADHRVRRNIEHGIETRVVVIDVDRRAIDALGPWPWPRERLARVVEAAAAARPAAIAVDILFAESDARSPGQLARRLGTVTGRGDLLALADTLPDDDKRLAAAMRNVPVALGFVLDPDRLKSVPAAPIVIRGALPLRELWRAAGASGPVAELEQAAEGFGALSLPGDADGLVRRVPLLVGGGALLPGLALEAVRLKQKASAYLIDASPPMLRAGELAIPLPDDALLRLVPAAADRYATRTISAADLAEGRADTGRLAGAIVMIGGSAPELGGLRQTVSDPVTPSVQIQADAVAQIAAQRVPRPLAGAAAIAMLFLIAMAAIAITAGASLAPLGAAACVLAAIALAWVAALSLSLFADRLLDPLTPSAAAAVLLVATSGTAYAATRRREALVRRRFEQHLAPAVVRRIVEQPGLMKLSGERREVTSLFTDIEGFTAMTHRAEPERLVAALDDYFEGLAEIVVDHGGMVEKIVGDAIHALFNAPIDLAGHPQRAVACATALHQWAETYRSRPTPAALGFGRTRIGIETGPAVVGDVGIRAKLDYTAHGDAINAAARLEAANKDLGSSICVGPCAASRCDPALLRPLGKIILRGRDETLPVFEPWPLDAPPDWRARYMQAFALIEADPHKAALLFDRLAAERPEDPVPHRLAQRCREAAPQPR
jgi:adenylate cyclase